MSDYSADAALALADLRDAGEAVTFTLTTNVISESTGLVTASTSSVAGYAIRDEDDFKAYLELGLVQKEPITLLFGPSTAGSEPSLGSTFSWNSTTYRVYRTRPITPNATGIAWRVIGGR